MLFNLIPSKYSACPAWDRWCNSLLSKRGWMCCITWCNSLHLNSRQCCKMTLTWIQGNVASGPQNVVADKNPRSGDEDMLWVPEHDGYLVTMDEWGQKPKHLETYQNGEDNKFSKDSREEVQADKNPRSGDKTCSGYQNTLGTWWLIRTLDQGTKTCSGYQNTMGTWWQWMSEDKNQNI